MLYATCYAAAFPSRREELAYQRHQANQLLQWALQREFSQELSSLTVERAPGGKPFFSDSPIHFSVSHCHGLVCCGVSLFPLGVDVESPRPFSARLLQRVCTQEECSWLENQPCRETAFLSLWTLKESVMKLSGQGIGYGFQQASFSFPEGKPCFQNPEVRLSQFFLEEGQVVSVASRKETFPEIHFVNLV